MLNKVPSGYLLYIIIMKLVRKLSKILLTCFLALVLLTGFLSLASRFKFSNKVPLVGGYQSINVLGASMEPAIKLGSVVFVKDMDGKEIKVDDIITFKAAEKEINKENTLITHRVVKIIKDKNTYRFKTKGDGNKTEDENLVNESQLVGKVSLTVPYAGQLGFFTKTPLGFLFLIVAPGLFIIIIEAINIGKHFRGTKNESAA